MPPIIPLVAGIIGGAKVIGDMYGAEQERKRTIDSLKDLSEITPAEREYAKRRREIIKVGDPLLNQELNRNTQIIRQQGQFNRQNLQGQVIQQGLENSIVAQELRRRVDDDVLRSVAEQARQMAIRNAEAKRQAELELEAMNLRTDARKQEYGAKIKQVGGYDRSASAQLMRLAQIGIGAYGGYQGGLGLLDGEEEFDILGEPFDWLEGLFGKDTEPPKGQNVPSTLTS